MTDVLLHCPHFYGFDEVYEQFLELSADKVRANTKLYAAYGCFPGQLWNGGRSFHIDKVDKSEIEKTFDKYDELGIKVELTFNNKLIKSDLLKDDYCNYIASAANERCLMCIIASKELEQYLRDKFTKLKFKRSCICCVDDEPDYDIENYDMTVLNQFKSCDLELLNNIPKDKRYKVEIVVNAECADNCKMFKLHHDFCAEVQLYGDSEVKFKCPISDKLLNPIPLIENTNHYISPEKCHLFADELSYEHFKLVGRNDIKQCLHGISNYYLKNIDLNFMRKLYDITYQR